MWLTSDVQAQMWRALRDAVMDRACDKAGLAYAAQSPGFRDAVARAYSWEGFGEPILRFGWLTLADLQRTVDAATLGETWIPEAVPIARMEEQILRFLKRPGCMRGPGH